ncbi:hypothetical protein TNCT_487081 [Trichonephila clavata]|uniref:Uncharacterized protein n=1 Tax=Trichonephila clavata TaxID=2740835 RepID=A0A8X6FIJ9_TRICU|nr:hypothetical protein TNCT_487081 [Trichonephila clavata]
MALKELFILAVAVLSFVRVVTCAWTSGVVMCVPPLPVEDQIQWKNLNEEHSVELNADNLACYVHQSPH